MNKDYIRRDEIIFGNYDASRYKYGGCARADINLTQLKTLIAEDFIDFNECQNDSPTTKDFIETIDGCDCEVLFEIYAIDKNRSDYRVTIEGVNVLTTDINCFCFLIEEWRYADELTVNADNNKYSIRAWWD